MADKPKTPKITIEAEGLKITIEGETNDFWMRDLYTRAVVHLVKEADISAWQKDDMHASEIFTSEVLTALAWGWRIDALDPDSEPKIASEMLEHIVAWLKETGRLSQNIEHVSEDDSEESADLS